MGSRVCSPKLWSWLPTSVAYSVLYCHSGLASDSSVSECVRNIAWLLVSLTFRILTRITKQVTNLTTVSCRVTINWCRYNGTVDYIRLKIWLMVDAVFVLFQVISICFGVTKFGRNSYITTTLKRKSSMLLNLWLSKAWQHCLYDEMTWERLVSNPF